jgi:multisubunit Na+/H+ antiporter MnhE subunit
VLLTGPIGADRGDRPSVAYLIGAGLVAFGALFGVWIALVGQADLQDNLAGLVAAGVGVAVGWFVTVGGRAVPQLRRSDLVEVVRLGPALCRQTIGVYRAAWRRAQGLGPPGGFRTMATDVGGGGWTAARRSAIVGALLSVTPGTIVVDIDADSGLATVHDFVAQPPGSVP